MAADTYDDNGNPVDNGDPWDPTPGGDIHNPDQPNKRTTKGLEYWFAQGFSADDIFDAATGQLKKGWLRTADGYDHDGTVTPGSGKKTATTAPPPGGGLIDPFGEVFKAPDWTPTPDAPTFHAPDYKPPPKFEAPTYADVQNETGYQFARDEGMRAIEHSKAAGGVYNSPGTLKDLARFNTGLADQTYGNVFNRKAQTYDENYKTQYADPYKNAYTSAWDTFNSLLSPWQTNAQSIQRKNEFDYKSAWDAYQFDYKKWIDRINESKDLTGM